VSRCDDVSPARPEHACSLVAAGWSSGSPDSLTAEQHGMRARLMIAGSLLYPQQQNCGTRDWLKACPRVRRTRLMSNDAAMMALVA
jgi:hypothetical protein